MNYEHRMMRCKLDRSALIAGHRYRPGERLLDEHAPTDEFEEFEPKAAPAPGTKRIKTYRPPPVARATVHPAE